MRHAGVSYFLNGPVYVRVYMELTNDSFLRGSLVHVHRSHIVTAMLRRLLSSPSDDHSSQQNCLELLLTPGVRVTIFRTTRNVMPIKKDFFFFFFFLFFFFFFWFLCKWFDDRLQLQ